MEDWYQQKTAANAEDSGKPSNNEPTADYQQQFVWKQQPEHSICSLK